MEQELEQKHYKKNRADQLVALLTGLSASQRQLTQTALDYQCLALAKKRQIKEQIELAEEVGCILKILINLLREAASELTGCDYDPYPES